MKIYLFSKFELSISFSIFNKPFANASKTVAGRYAVSPGVVEEQLLATINCAAQGGNGVEYLGSK